MCSTRRTTVALGGDAGRRPRSNTRALRESFCCKLASARMQRAAIGGKQPPTNGPCLSNYMPLPLIACHGSAVEGHDHERLRAQRGVRLAGEGIIRSTWSVAQRPNSRHRATAMRTGRQSQRSIPELALSMFTHADAPTRGCGRSVIAGLPAWPGPDPSPDTGRPCARRRQDFVRQQ
jgi:hypothetical protein